MSVPAPTAPYFRKPWGIATSWLFVLMLAIGAIAGIDWARIALTRLPPPPRIGLWCTYLGGWAGGSTATQVEQARRAGISSVYVKAADGGDTFKANDKRLAPTIAAFHAAGIQVYAWNFVYGINPLGEQRRAAETVRFGFDGLIWDVEGKFASLPAATQAEYADSICRLAWWEARESNPGFLFGITSFGRINKMPMLGWWGFAAYCSEVQPQVYWQEWIDKQTHERWTPERALAECGRQWADAMKAHASQARQMRIVPLGYVRSDSRGKIPATELRRFLERSSRFGERGIWRAELMDAAHWQAVAAYSAAHTPRPRQLPSIYWQFPLAIYLLWGIGSWLARGMLIRPGGQQREFLLLLVLWPGVEAFLLDRNVTALYLHFLRRHSRIRSLRRRLRLRIRGYFTSAAQHASTTAAYIQRMRERRRTKPPGD